MGIKEGYTVQYVYDFKMDMHSIFTIQHRTLTIQIIKEKQILFHLEESSMHVNFVYLH